MTHATPEPGLFCTSSTLTDSFLLSPSPTLSGLWGVKMPGWLQCSPCLWHFKSWLPSAPFWSRFYGQCVDLNSLYFHDSLSSHYNLTLCPLLQCNLRPPQTFVTFIQTSCNPQETAPLVFFITEWNWILICDFFWQTLTRGETLCLGNIVSLIHLLFSSKCHPGHVGAMLRLNQGQMLRLYLVILCTLRILLELTNVVPPVNYLGLKWQIDVAIELLLKRHGSLSQFPSWNIIGGWLWLRIVFSFVTRRMDGAG